MGLKHRKWLGAGTDVAARAAFSLAMCGALAGLLYLTAQDGLADLSTAQQTNPRTATILASLDARPQMDRAQAVVDASPISLSLPAGIPAAVAVVPTERPAIPTKRPATPVKMPIAKADVARFDRCSPSCDTRDPMIVGYADRTQEVAFQAPEFDEEIERPVVSPVLAGASNLLEKALDAPSAAFRKGRAVIKTVVRATL
jgi:hypothetical protein